MPPSVKHGDSASLTPHSGGRATIPIRLERQHAGLQTPSAQVTKQTVEVMCRHVAAAMKDPLVHRAAEVITRGATSPLDCLSKTYWWIKTHVKFVQDADLIARMFGERDHFELLISPSVMLRMREPQGDCDCFTMLGLALAQGCGFEGRIVTICCDHGEPDRYSHVCAEIKMSGGRWITFDASHGKSLGWEIPEHDQYRRTSWNLNARQVSDVVSLKKKRRRHDRSVRHGRDRSTNGGPGHTPESPGRQFAPPRHGAGCIRHQHQ